MTGNVVPGTLKINRVELERVFAKLELSTDSERADYLGVSRAWFTKVKNGRVEIGPRVMHKLLTRLGPLTTFEALFGLDHADQRTA